MTSYSRYRKYPSPTSDRERGAGGPHSEDFARAVARDLDVLDAGYLAVQQRPGSVMVRGADSGAIFISGDTRYIPFDTVESTSPGGIQPSTGSSSFFVPRGFDGWYNINVTVHTAASGTVTANVRHRVSIVRTGQRYGNTTVLETREHETYQATATEIYMQVEGVMHIQYGDTLEARYFHANASDMILKAVGSRFSATLIAAG